MSLLDDARKRINAIDADMARLFEERMQAVEDVIRYKQGHAAHRPGAAGRHGKNSCIF